MKTSIVIPLGRGSRNNDLELRYCLRSIEKHLTGYGDVFIVGEKPDWLRGVIHIPCQDQGDKTFDKERNIFYKVLAACADERVSDSFLFMNDDHFLLQEYEAGQFPNYYYGLLKDYKTVTDYKYTVRNTIEYFKQYWSVWAVYGPFEHSYCDIHCPILYNKIHWKEIQPLVDLRIRFGYCLKTFYSYYSKLDEDWIEYPDLKINEAYPAAKIRELIAGRAWFSIGDKAFNGDIKRVLQELYPLKSRYE